MRDLLYLTHRIPYPPNKGDKIRAYHVLRYLQAHFRVHLGTFIDHADDEPHAPTLAEGCASTCMIRLSPRLARWRSLPALLAGQPLSVRYYQHRALQRWVLQTLAAHDIAVALAFSGPMAQYVPTDVGWPLLRVMDLVDVDSEKWRVYGESSTWPLAGLYRREARRLLDYERNIAGRFNHTLLVSHAEAEVLRALVPGHAHQIDYFNNGVDSEFFSPDHRFDSPYHAPVNLVFTGALDYAPNIDAVAWFARRVVPALLAMHPGLAFHIVGARPAAEVLALRHLPGVAIHANVPDVRPYLLHATLAVAPLFLARGVQNKVLEAMAMQKTVIATPQAVEGIAAVAGQEMLVAADQAGFVERIASALTSPAVTIGVAARQRVLQDYRWDHNLARLGRLLGVESGTAQVSVL
jgi:sugar transferase (PEP-CTERM/EpsH1 system associated)